MMRGAIVLLFGLIASGCATQPESAEEIAAQALASTGEDPRIVCKKEKPTGSNRPIKVCRQVSDPIDREHVRRDMGVLQRQTEALSPPPP